MPERASGRGTAARHTTEAGVTRYLIVNADDFGATRGINRGIVEAFHRGIVTSTSLMVTMPASEDAASLASRAPGLSVGLHVDLYPDGMGATIDPDEPHTCIAELRRQLLRFEALTGRRPTHLDSHHNSHRDPRLLACFLRVAREQKVPLREHSPARYLSSFYGRWGEETHAEQVGIASLVRMLDDEIGDGITELGCHPGYADEELRSSYATERELELRTLCDPAIPLALRDRGIALIGFDALDGIASGRASEGT